MKKYLLSLCFLSISLIAETVCVKDFGALPNDGLDDAPAIRKALEHCRTLKESELVFEPGQYDFSPALCEEKYFYISNNDEGLKRIAFNIHKFKNFSINGKGAQFMFHGFVNPFIISESENVLFKNFSIDFSRPFHSEGTILANHPDGLDVEFKKEFPYNIHRGILLFTDHQKTQDKLTSVSKGGTYGSSHILEFDSEKKETAYMVYDYYFKEINGFPAKKLGKNKVRILVPGLKGKVGNTMVFGPNHRKYPGFVISDSKGTRFDKVTIHHAGGMGIIGQRSHNILVKDCKVTPSGERMLSTTADATHFVNCTGYITLENNLFENQKDDATNIHGIYVQVKEITGKNELIYQIKHRQQYGFDFMKAGMKIEFVRGKSMETYEVNKVKSVERINKEFTKVTFEKDFSSKVQAMDALAEVRDYPEILIKDNIIRRNRARGMLLNCRGKTLVEGNYFHSPGAAILFEGDSCFWFEQGGVSDCVIRNNVFDNCMYGVWGKAVIDVKAGIREDRETSRYNKNILVENNTFKVYDEGTLLNAYCVDGIIWRKNKVEKTNAYPQRKKKFERYITDYCDRVSIAD